MNNVQYQEAPKLYLNSYLYKMVKEENKLSDIQMMQAGYVLIPPIQVPK